MVHNEFNKPFIVSGKGVSRMDFHYQWEHEEAPKRGLRNPWAHRPDRPIRYEEVISKIAGTEVKGKKPIYNDYTDEEIVAWKAERDEYMRQRDEWLALQMFHEYGYETFLNECKALSSIREDFWKTVLPCESHSDSQCSFLCPIFNDCAIRVGEEMK